MIAYKGQNSQQYIQKLCCQQKYILFLFWEFQFQIQNLIFINYSMKSLSPSKSGFLSELYASRQSSYHGNNAFETVDSTLYCDILYQQKYKRKLECYKMSVNRNTYKSFLQVHQWRCKTSLPIVKSYYIDIIDDHTQLICLESFQQYIPQRLQSIFNISLVQALYLIKQSLIGFERLLQKFGGFYPTDKMIGINQNNKCKVWINQSYNENKFNPANIKDSQFCLKILGLFKNHIADSQLTDRLWKKLLQKPTFISIFKTIEQFALENKLKIPNKFDQYTNEKPSDLCSTIPDSSLIYSKRSINSKASTNKGKEGFRSQHQSKKFQKYQTNKCTTDKKLSFKENGKKSDFSIFAIKIKTQQDNYDIQTPREAYENTPKTPKTPNRHFESQYRKKTGSMFRSSEVDFAFLKEQFEPVSIRQRKYSANEHTSKTTNPQFIFRNSKADTNEENQEIFNANPILAKHGWEKKVDGLMSLGNVKQSIIEGGDVPLSDSMIRCEKLDVFANQIVRSMLPSDLEIIPDDIYL